MSDIIIRVENLGKLYRIGEGNRHDTFRDMLTASLTAPFRRAAGLFHRNGRAPSVDHPADIAPDSASSIQPPESISAEAPPPTHPHTHTSTSSLPHSHTPSASALITPSPLHPVTPSSVTPDHIWALKDVSFEVRRGEVLGIIGRNGAGKSTLLKILSRITEPTEGRVEIHGRVASLLEVGTGFHPELTGRENIYLNGAILGMSRREIERKFDEIVAFSEVERFIDTPVKRYSSGMYVRLAFAVAAHLDPEILVIDEVLSVGDAEFQKRCLGKMEDVAGEGRTVLFVSHNMYAVQNLCSRGILLDAGCLSIDGGIGQVVEQYLAFGKVQSGEICWDAPVEAPGNDRLRLRAIRIVSGECVTATPEISKPFRVEVDYWNLEQNGRRLVSIHLHNSKGVCILTSGNLPSACLSPDPWFSRQYPVGLFRTTCLIPGDFLNDGLHTITLYINERGATDNILLMHDVLSFTMKDGGSMRKEYTGEWIGAVRPRLEWLTVQLDSNGSRLATRDTPISL